MSWSKGFWTSSEWQNLSLASEAYVRTEGGDGRRPARALVLDLPLFCDLGKVL